SSRAATAPDQTSFPTRRSSDLEAKTSDEAIQLVTNLEKALRSWVRDRLSRTSGDWWSTRVPINVRTRAETYRQRADALYPNVSRSEEHTSELQSRFDLVCRLLL